MEFHLKGGVCHKVKSTGRTLVLAVQTTCYSNVMECLLAKARAT